MARRALGALVGAAVLVVAAVVGSRHMHQLGVDAAQPVASVAGASVVRAPVPAEVQVRARASLLRVESTSCGLTRQGTATVVRLPGTGAGDLAVLTNRHVVAGTTLAVADDGAWLGDLVVAGSVPRRDAVRLRTTGDLPADAALEAGPMPEVGDPVVVAGYPGGEFMAAEGTIVAVQRRHGYGGETQMLLVDVDAEPGLSGGVVVDRSGRAVGLVAARDPSTHDTVAYPIAAVSAGPSAGPPSC
ncbi:MAG: S1 family peptidase [Microthrixaceae bacterium]